MVSRIANVADVGRWRVMLEEAPAYTGALGPTKDEEFPTRTDRPSATHPRHEIHQSIETGRGSVGQSRLRKTNRFDRFVPAS